MALNAFVNPVRTSHAPKLRATDMKEIPTSCASRKLGLIFVSSLVIPFLTSCVTKPDNPAACSCYDHFMSMQTRQQGVSDAKCHIRDKGFRILRYDMPSVRTGGLPDYYLAFQHFGIEEADEFFASLEYCQGYNGEMDRQLLKRYGSEYRQFRGKILPKPGAGRYKASP